MPNEISNIKPHLVHTHDVQIDSDYTQWLVLTNAAFSQRLHQLGGETTEAILPQLWEKYSSSLLEKQLIFRGSLSPDRARVSPLSQTYP